MNQINHHFYYFFYIILAGDAGLEPTNVAVKVLCLTDLANPLYKVVSAQGFEPRTHALEGRCSIQLSYAPTLYGKFGAGNEIRTRDFDLGKVALYR